VGSSTKATNTLSERDRAIAGDGHLQAPGGTPTAVNRKRTRIRDRESTSRRTRRSFLSNATLRSGEQLALGHDLLALMDALKIPLAILACYDWGGRAACVVAALWPERAAGLVSLGG
jgi:pimeloyl-ACP methyl ester carboxylesterase